MKMTHRDFDLYVTQKQGQLLYLFGEEFANECKRLIFHTYSDDGDVSEMFALTLSELPAPSKWFGFDDDDDYHRPKIARLAAIQDTFNRRDV